MARRLCCLLFNSEFQFVYGLATGVQQGESLVGSDSSDASSSMSNGGRSDDVSVVVLELVG